MGSPKPFDKVEAFLGIEIAGDVQDCNTFGLNDKVDQAVNKAKQLILKK